jgi:hypothetical protein
VAKFIRQRGRVSLTELAENSNRLVSLAEGKTAQDEAAEAEAAAALQEPASTPVPVA